VDSHSVLCNYLVSEWTWRCDSRLKAVYLRLEVIHCCSVIIHSWIWTFCFYYLLWSQTFSLFPAQDCTVYDTEEKVLDVVSICLHVHFLFIFLYINQVICFTALVRWESRSLVIYHGCKKKKKLWLSEHLCQAQTSTEVINKLSGRLMPFFTIILEGHRKNYCWWREGQVFFDYRPQISSGGPLNKKWTVPYHAFHPHIPPRREIYVFFCLERILVKNDAKNFILTTVSSRVCPACPQPAHRGISLTEWTHKCQPSCFGS